MEVDRITSFSQHKLQSLADTLQYDDYSKAVEEGLTGLEFFRLIHAIRSEIKVLYDLTEAPSAIDSLDETRPFLYELSALLVELDCGQMQLLSGPLEDRFSSIANRQALVDFLLSELKTARLLEIERGKEPVKVVDTDVALALDSALAVLGAQRHQYPAKEAIDNVMRLGDSVLQNMSSRPTPLLHEKIDPILWGPIEQLCHRFAADLRARNLLLLKRIDVTVNSFLWSEKVRKHEREILQLYAARREAMTKVAVPDIILLLAASTDLLRIERASGSNVRQRTKFGVRPSVEMGAPKDRGGRIEDFAAPPRETFRGQRGGYGNRGGRGGGDRGFHRGGGRGRGDDDHQQRGGGGHAGRGGGRGGRGGYGSQEDQARNEYQQRHEEGQGPQYHRGGHQRGGWTPRGRGRGGGRPF